MKVFQKEIDDGLADTIKSDTKISVACSAVLVEEPVDYSLIKVLAGVNQDQFDLFYMRSVLASVGWNKNDDVFDRVESFNARFTPVDKPFNMMHNSKEVIGHITSSHLFDFDGKEIPNDSTLESIPEQFDIVVSSVIYKYWHDEEMQHKMDQIIAEIKEGKWFVSMECLFKHFDYAVVKPDGAQIALERNESTAFLTKHLRSYGGTGEFEGYKVGRLLRGFAFSGKGLVDRPANPRSLILNAKHEGIANFNSIASISEFPQEENNVMSKTYTQEEFDALKQELAVAKTQLKEANDKEVSALKQELAEVQKTLAKVNDELSAKNATIEANKETVAELNKQLDTAKASVDTLTQEIERQRLESVKAVRLSQLIEAGLDEAKAKELADKFVNVSDEVFTELVAAYKGKKDKDKKEEKEDKKSEANDKTPEEKALEDAKAEEDNLPTGEVDNKDEKVVAKASEWLKSILS